MELSEEGPFNSGKSVLFGVRPCDIQAILLLDKVFDNPDYKDPYYVDKRKRTLIIGMSCTNPRTTCFCTSFGIEPGKTTSADLFITDISGKYVVQVLTKEGDEVISKYNGWNSVGESDLAMVAKINEKAKAKIVSKVEVDLVKKKLDGMFEDPFWDTLHERCLGCATCTYLCSTCHCFDIIDEVVREQGVRIRNWDSCMFPLFTLHASGHNPRGSGKERMRQRIMHKFCYFVNYWGETGCVGCGRCIINCPVNIDIREVLNSIVSEEN
jgi:ferredoxin